MSRSAHLLVVFVLALGGWVVYQKVETGKWSVFPVKLSPEEQRVRGLEAELSDVEAKIAAEERTSGLAGAAPSHRLTELYDRRTSLTREVAEAKAGTTP